MEESHKKDLPLAIKVHFAKHPLLPTLIKNPTHYVQSPWTQLISQQLQSQFGTRGDRDFYRIVFSPGASGELMTIQKGPLAGLQTTSVVDGGKISSVAGLEKVDGQISPNLMPMLLTMGALNSIHARLSYIADICTDIRNRQIAGDKAKLERISEVIVDCFESMSEGDDRLNEDNLRRVTSNTDDCYEILMTLLDDLLAQHKEKEMDFESFDEHSGIEFYGTRPKLDKPTEVMRRLMQHSVFAAYDRYAAGRACQVVLSGNYSSSNIGRHKRALERVRDSIRTVFDERMERYKRGVVFLRQIIDNLNQGFPQPHWTVEGAQRVLDAQLSVIEKLESELYALLDARIADFDDIAKIFKNGKFQVLVVDGAMIFSEVDIPALECEPESSSECLTVTDQNTRGLARTH
ncbi:hypothetical protein [Massilia sp. AB1]|uniref:hypothetical protein n=1 Tax=Massilia sp. AB1 TaxID=2823371 RepID=UPI001B82B381|nr:hypothetical protein [Massilia sp. AB1]MBQ5942682.1 hypothetical protein [Massilia sp. AB1]